MALVPALPAQAGSRPAVRVLRHGGVAVVTDVAPAASGSLEQVLAPQLDQCLGTSRAWFAAAQIPVGEPGGLLVCVVPARGAADAALLAQADAVAGLQPGLASPRRFVVERRGPLVETLWVARWHVASFVAIQLAGLEAEDSRQRLFVAGLAARLADSTMAGVAVAGVEREACLRHVQERGDLMARFHGKGMLQQPGFGPEEWAIGWALLHFLEFREGGRSRAQVASYATAMAEHAASYGSFAECFAVEDMAEFGAAWKQHVATLIGRGAGWLERGGPVDARPRPPGR
jgi:hypothetical protein